MSRVVIVAAGKNLDNLPAEVNDVANILSAADWQVRLCIGTDAGRAGLQRATAEGSAELVWLGCHSDAAGFALADGIMSATELGIWLGGIRAAEVVLNSCFSLEHVSAIQRAARVNIAATIDPKGVSDVLAWSTAVNVAREYAISNDMQRAVSRASGYGATQYHYFRYIEPERAEDLQVTDAGFDGGLERGSSRVPASTLFSEGERLLLSKLARAVLGDEMIGPGLLKQLHDLTVNVSTLITQHDHYHARQKQLMIAIGFIVVGMAVLLLFSLWRLGLA